MVSFTPPHQKTCLIKICDWATCYAYEAWRLEIMERLEMGDGCDLGIVAATGMYRIVCCKMRHQMGWL